MSERNFWCSFNFFSSSLFWDFNEMAWECQPEHLPGGGLLDVSLEFFFQRSLARVLGNSVVDSFRACHMASRAVILI